MIALLPLDNRPCNLQFPAQIAAIGADQISRAARRMVGPFQPTRRLPRSCASGSIFCPKFPRSSFQLICSPTAVLVASRKTDTDLETRRF